LSKKSKKITPKSAAGKSKKAVAQNLPKEWQLLFNQGVEAHRQGNLQQAVDIYSQVLQTLPDHADSLHLVGLVFKSSGDLVQAETFICRAIALSPQIAGYHFNFGVLLQESGDNSRAAEAYRNSIRLNPNNLQAYENLGVALHDMGNLKAALPAYKQALALNKESLVALKNLGTLYYNKGNTAESLMYFNKALALSPADPELHLKRSGSLLRMGQWLDGWQEYSWRFNAPIFLETNAVRSIGLPLICRSDTTDFNEKRVLISCEQGLGDEIMFASCFADAIKQASHCVLECDPRLLAMYSRSFPGATVVAKNQFDANTLDCYVRAGDLPYFFRTVEADFKGVAYLYADAEKRQIWEDRLKTLPHSLKIGFSWRGGAVARAVAARSVDLKHWRPLFKCGDTNFVNLQYRTSQQELAELNEVAGESLCHFDELDAFNDIEALAALISELDLVISADNATVHLAGALGVPVWVLLPEGPERRWTDGRNDSVWYDSARIFRSSVTGSEGWPAVFKRVIDSLCNFQPQVLGKRIFSKLPDTLRSVSQNIPTAKFALLLNDTSDWYHWGCSGTSLAIHAALRERGYLVRGIPIAQTNALAELPSFAGEFESNEIFEAFTSSNAELVRRIQEANIVIVNGEGSLHGNSLTALGLLYLAHIAKSRFQKTVQIINHSCYPDVNDGRGESALCQLYTKIYNELDYVAIREPISRGYMETLGVKSVQSFDCLPLFIRGAGVKLNALDGNGPIVLAGSVVWMQSMGDAVISFVSEMAARGLRVELLLGASAYMAGDDVKFVQRLQAEACGKFEIMYAATETEWLTCIARASVLVSGRFHHSIAAAFLNTPFVVCESNTTKISGLLEMLDMPVAFAVAGEDLSARLVAMVTDRQKSPRDYCLADGVKQDLYKAAECNFDGVVNAGL
jgi:Flp pilus assembly protein TadD/polysaccharide pyruvyl transferase WcaK-like protein